MQLIRADQLLRPLRDFTIFSRLELGRNRRV